MSSRYIATGLAILLCALFLAPSNQQATPWIEVPFEAVGLQHIADASLASYDGNVYVAGNAVTPDRVAVTRWQDSAVVFAAVVRLSPAGTPELLGAPEFRGGFNWPRIFVTAGPTVHLLWGTTDSSFAPRFRPEAPYGIGGIWHSRYTDGRWSEPTRIVSGYIRGWQAGSGGQPAESRGMHVMALTVDPAVYATEITLLVISDSTVRVLKRPRVGADLYPGVAAGRDGEVAVAALTNPPVGSRIRVMRASVENGQFRTPITAESLSIGRPATLGVAGDGNGTVHLVFAVSGASERLGRNVWRYLRSTDGGESWDEPRWVVAGVADAYAPVLVPRPCGAVSIYYHSPPSLTPYVTDVQADGESTTAVAAAGEIGVFAVTTEANGRVHYLKTVWDSVSQRPRTYYSTQAQELSTCRFQK